MESKTKEEGAIEKMTMAHKKLIKANNDFIKSANELKKVFDKL